MTTLQEFLRNMRHLRKAAGLNQQQLGDIVGFDDHTISRYERGVREPIASDLDRLLQALGVSVTLTTPGGEDGETPPAAGFCPVLKEDCLDAICALYDDGMGGCSLRASNAPQR